MRLLIDTLIALMLAGILAAVLWHYRREEQQIRQVQGVHMSLARMQEQMLYRGALGEVPTGPNGFPREVSPLWFADGLPTNNMVPGRQPWLDLAADDDMADHPPDPVIRRPAQAGFWYNPNRGIFRARVAPQFTQDATLDLYNTLNGASLPELRESPASEARTARTAAAPDAPDVSDTAPNAVEAAASPAPPPPKVPTLRDQDR